MLRRGQYVPRVDHSSSCANFKVQVWATRMPGGACRANGLALGNVVSTLNEDSAEMGVKRLKTRSVVDHDHVAVAITVGSGIDYNAAVRSINIVAHIGSQVDAKMIGLC